MGKVIRLRSFIGYSVIIGFCSLFVEANLAIYLDTKNKLGMSFSHLDQNHIFTLLSYVSYLSQITRYIYLGIVVMSIVFIVSTVSYICESHSSIFSRLSLIGASRWQIFTLFIRSLVKLFAYAIPLGAIIGSYLSRFFSNAYVSCMYSIACEKPTSVVYIPPTNLMSIVYTCVIMVVIVAAGVVFNLKKFLFFNPLQRNEDKHSAQISSIRIMIAIIVTIGTVWFYTAAHNINLTSGNNNKLIFGILEILNFYLYLPLILKLVLPAVYSLLQIFFPITGLLTKKYFYSTIRKYVSLTAPVILCFMFTLLFFSGLSAEKVLDHEIYASPHAPITAVSTNISPIDKAHLDYDLMTAFRHDNVLAAPVRSDPRWAEKGTLQRIPHILETQVPALVKIFHAHIIAGDIHQVHGINIASMRHQDTLGQVLHLISPAGKNIDAHIVALLKPVPNFIDSSYILTDYASFPEANTVFHSYYDPINDIFGFNYSPQNYSIIYQGITADHLGNLGISAISYDQWMSNFIDQSIAQIRSQYFALTSPIVLTCLALVIVNSIAFSGTSAYIRRVMSIIGGTQWQDVRMLTMQLASIFVFALALSPIPMLLNKYLIADYIQQVYHLSSPFVLPYQELSIVTVMLIIAGLIPLLTKILYTRRKNSQ